MISRIPSRSQWLQASPGGPQRRVPTPAGGPRRLVATIVARCRRLRANCGHRRLQASPSGLRLQFSLPCRKQEYPTGAEGKLWPGAAPGRPRRARAASGAAGGGPGGSWAQLGLLTCGPMQLSAAPEQSAPSPPAAQSNLRRRPTTLVSSSSHGHEYPSLLPRVLRSSFAGRIVSSSSPTPRARPQRGANREVVLCYNIFLPPEESQICITNCARSYDSHTADRRSNTP